jgi:hypothetical protein
MKDSNKDIEVFFVKMHKEDAQISIPSLETILPQKKVFSIKKFLPIGIAASLLLSAGILFQDRDKASTPEQEVIISLEIPNLSSEILLSAEPSMDDWESSSAFLLNDFND